MCSAFKMSRRYLVVVLLWAFPMAMAQTTDSNDNIATGIFKENVYTNRALGISYPLPSDWYSNDALTNGRKVFDGAMILFVADRHTGTGLKERVLLTVDETRHYQRPPLDSEKYTAKLARALVKTAAATTTTEVHPTHFGSRRFYRANYETTSGGMLYHSLACTRLGAFFVCWNFVTAESLARLDEMVQSLSNATFTK